MLKRKVQLENGIEQLKYAYAHLTILVKELVDGSLLWVEKQCGHVIVSLVGAEELPDGRVNVLTVGLLKKIK